MKKEYVEIELKAKNAPSGSYAAGCPVNYPVGGNGKGNGTCRQCFIAG